MTTPNTTPRRNANKAKASTPGSGAKKQSTGKFEAQLALKEWFQGLTTDQKDAVRQEFKKFIRLNTTTTETGCVVWTKKSGGGVGSRSKDEGRKTFKPFIWLNGLKNGKFSANPTWHKIVKETTATFKGPEVNLATIWATIYELDTHIENKLVCSHLCHNKECVNLDHLCWEQQEINNHRNFCKVPTCNHAPKCLVNGPSIVSKDAAAKTMVYDKTQEKFVTAAKN